MCKVCNNVAWAQAAKLLCSKAAAQTVVSAGHCKATKHNNDVHLNNKSYIDRIQYTSVYIVNGWVFDTKFSCFKNYCS